MTEARRARRLVIGFAPLVILLTALVASCGALTDERTVVTVSAASSLTDTMKLAERIFEAENPGYDLRVNTGGSNTLAFQIEEGAGVDVLLTADRVTMDRLGDRVSGVDVVARNRLVLLHRTDDPRISAVGDLADPTLVVVACDEAVPCGRLTARYLDESGLDVDIDSREANVRIARERVVSGEADAAFVYTTDVRDDDQGIAALALPTSVRNDVVIASVSDSTGTEVFREFFDTQGGLYLEMTGFEVE